MDTPSKMEQVQAQLLRKGGIAKRFNLARSLSQTTIELSRSAIKKRNPRLTSQEILVKFVELCYGDELNPTDTNEIGTGVNMSIPDIVQAILPVVEVFEQLGVGYYIGGSVASSAHGLPRSTLDVDLVADLRPTQVASFVGSLEKTYYIDPEMILDAIHREASFNIMHLETMIKIDIFILKHQAFDQQAFKRIQQTPLSTREGDQQFSLASPEDIALYKLWWYRLGGEVSERQWNDVLGVFKVQGEALDVSYMKHWAGVIDVLDLLNRALQDAGIGDLS